MLSRSAKVLCLILLFLAFFTRCQAQQTCPLKLEELPNAPELFGFRLGMTPEQAKAKAPLIRFGNADAFGVLKTSISPSFDPRFDQTAFLGARTISFEFLDGRLATLWIGYDDRFKWQNVDEFVNGIRKSLNLKADFSLKGGGRQLTCEGFSIFVSMIANSPSMRLIDEAAENTIAARREEAVEEAEAVVGDKSTKNYYRSECEAAARIAAASRVTFKNKEEAEKAGYTLAKDCK